MGAGPSPATSADTELPSHVAPGGLGFISEISRCNVLTILLQFWPGRRDGWVGAAASSRQQLCSHKAVDAAVTFPVRIHFKHGKLSSPRC